MRLQFESRAPHQIEAVNSVTDIFIGQPYHDPTEQFTLGDVLSISNLLDLDHAQILRNVNVIQEREALRKSTALALTTATISSDDGDRDTVFPNFSIEMETGTGKTYVYIRTALELASRFGFTKYVIVVPSIAIREGVLKTFEVTRDHFRAVFNGLPYRYAVYNSGQLSSIRQFCWSQSIEFLIMTIDSFTRDSNIIRQQTDRLQGETPLHLLQAARPIVIMDEPQNMETPLRANAIASLNPLFTLRYSATHKTVYDLVYRLTPWDAYRRGLVKKVEVAGIERANDALGAFVALDKIDATSRSLSARLRVQKAAKDGSIKEAAITVRPGSNLARLTGRALYDGFIVEEIDRGIGSVTFSNGVIVRLGEASGISAEQQIEAQIRYTIGAHFRKARSHRAKGVKVLSLFFLSHVDDYQAADGVVRTTFERVFSELSKANPEWSGFSAADVSAAYFAQRKTKSGQVLMQDSTSGTTEEDREAYDLIMRDKERLLSFDEPVAFIFSHSALREGWDNPNIFQVCTLHRTRSDIRKRQEIGRGVRLAVDQRGERVYNDAVNVLTVIANQDFATYVAEYQMEVRQDFGDTGAAPQPANARARTVARINDAVIHSRDFARLWARISPKTRFTLKVDTDRLISDAVQALSGLTVAEPSLVVSKAQIVADGEQFDAQISVWQKRILSLRARVPFLPNIVDVVTQLLTNASPPIRVTKATIFSIIARGARYAEIRKNPQEFAEAVTHIIRDALLSQIGDGIRYSLTGSAYSPDILREEIEGYAEAAVDVPAPPSLYDRVFVDSQIERSFAAGLKARSDIRLFLKLPDSFTVATPVGNYNPDWAILVEGRDEHGAPTGADLFLIRETKGSADPSAMRRFEDLKVRCGVAHFSGALAVDFRVVSAIEDI